MLLFRTTFGTCHKSCSHLYTLCSECEGSPHTACIHNPSGGNDRNTDVICDLWDKRHSSNHSLFIWKGNCYALSHSFSILLAHLFQLIFFILTFSMFFYCIYIH